MQFGRTSGRFPAEWFMIYWIHLITLHTLIMASEEVGRRPIVTCTGLPVFWRGEAPHPTWCERYKCDPRKSVSWRSYSPFPTCEFCPAGKDVLQYADW